MRPNTLELLTEFAAESPMGILLRKFWQPIARSASLEKGTALGIHALGEELTLFRGHTGRPYLVAGRCAHRCTVLHTGWVEDEAIRCMYHGWKYAGQSGQCIEMPAERGDLAAAVRIISYPLHEYAGLIFAYLGPAPAPAFQLPRKDVFERTDYVMGTLETVWDCNWFQQIENSLDGVHVSFVHVWGRMSRFGEEITTALPSLSFTETSSGLRQVATRSKRNVRISDWTFPNNNHVVSPGPHKDDPWVHVSGWAVPIDAGHTRRFIIYAFPSQGDDVDQRILCDYGLDYHPANHSSDLFHDHRLPEHSTMHLLQGQDYVAMRGQGAVVNRARERLVRSDAGIALLRKIFLRELDRIRQGRPTKDWQPLEESTDLPIQIPESAPA